MSRDKKTHPKSSIQVHPLPCMKADQQNQINVHHITRTLPAWPIKLQQIREETAKDKTLALLWDIRYEGWPNSRSEFLLPSCDFCKFREDLTIEDGRDHSKVWLHRRTARAKTRHPENHPRRPRWRGRMSSQSPFCCVLAGNHKWRYPICQPVCSMQETPEENVKGTTAATRAAIDRGKCGAPNYLNTEITSIYYYLTIIASYLPLGS